MHRAKIALVVGLALLALAIVLTLSQSPPSTLADNSVTPVGELVANWTNASGCQTDEQLPGGTRAIRLSLSAFTGPKVAVTARSASRLLTSGESGSGWTGRTVTIPVRPVTRAAQAVAICFTAAPNREGVGVYGSDLGVASALRTSSGQAFPVRMTIEYVGAGHMSWIQLASTVVTHMALGRAWSGTWVAVLVVVLMIAAAILASRSVPRDLG